MIYQGSEHFATILAIIVYILLPTPSFTYGDMVLLMITVIMRCFIIAVRYGFMSNMRYIINY